MSRTLTFRPGDRVRVLSQGYLTKPIGTVIRRSPRTDGILYDVEGDGWAGTFYNTSLRKVG